MATKFKTRENAKASKGEVQKNMEIMTVPDNATSLRDIISRFATGVPVTQSSGAVYNPEWEFDDIKNMDVLDVHELKQHHADILETKKQKADEDKANLAKAKATAKANAQAKKEPVNTGGQSNQ